MNVAKTRKKPKPIAKKKPAAKSAAKKKPVKKSAAKKSAAKKPAAAKKAPRGVPEILRDTALKVLDDRQAEDIVTVNLAGRSAMADYLIIASGRSTRQVSAIADYLRDGFLKYGAKKVQLEGRSEGNWVLVDAGDVVVHLFRPEVRRYYNLDSIWDSKNQRHTRRMD